MEYQTFSRAGLRDGRREQGPAQRSRSGMGRKEVKKWPHFTEKEIVQKGDPRKA
jgi:hypothetical protein